MAQRINITISDDLKLWLFEESKRKGIPQSTLVILALNDYKERNNKSK